MKIKINLKKMKMVKYLLETLTTNINMEKEKLFFKIKINTLETLNMIKWKAMEF